MKLFKFNKKSVVAGAAIGALMGLAITAAAYWTSTGSSTGTATTGTSTTWQVDTLGNSGGPLYPGSGAITVNYKVTNNNAGHQGLANVVVTVDHDANGDVLVDAVPNTDPPVAVTDCKASWFDVVNNFQVDHSTPVDLANGASSTNHSTVSLRNESAINQGPCKSVTDLHLTISAS